MKKGTERRDGEERILIGSEGGEGLWERGG